MIRANGAAPTRNFSAVNVANWCDRTVREQPGKKNISSTGEETQGAPSGLVESRFETRWLHLEMHR